MPVSSHLSNSHLSNSQLSNSQLSTPPLSTPPISTPQLSIRTACSAADARSYIAHQYATYPFRLSGNLRLDPADSQRVYAYVMNASPGILSGDDLRWSVEVGDRTSLYLTDQSATKVYSKPPGGQTAKVAGLVQVGAGAYLEYVPEPVILFSAADVTQRLDVRLHPEGRLVLSEIVVPGRLARGECYAFETFQSWLQIEGFDRQLCFVENFRLVGQTSRFRKSKFRICWPITATFVVIFPGLPLNQLSQALQLYIDEQGSLQSDSLQACDSPLPNCHGLWIRAIATQVSVLKDYQRHILNTVRRLSGQPPLPIISK